MGRKLHILQHSLGLDEYGEGRQYRNHFVTGEGSDDFPACRELVVAGLMVERVGNELTGGDSIFSVTPQGIDYVKHNSPTRPQKRKLTRSQQRYQDWRNSESGLTFAEWIGVAR